MKKQPIHSEMQKGQNSIVLSNWGVSEGGTLSQSEDIYKEGSVLSLKADKTYEMATDASKVDAVLLAEVDAKTANVEAPLQLGGEVDENLLVFAGGLTADDTREVFRDKNIYLKKRG